jgi:hypothetical protein
LRACCLDNGHRHFHLVLSLVHGHGRVIALSIAN